MRIDQFWKRATVFAVLGPAALASVLAGSPWIDRAVLLCGFLAIDEVAFLFEQMGIPFSRRLAVALFPLLVQHRSQLQREREWEAGLVLGTSILGHTSSYRLEAVWAGGAAAMIAYPMRAALAVRAHVNGDRVLVWGISTIWMNDAAAYLIGRKLGGRPFPPWINSKKTYLGLLPGWCLSTLSGLVYANSLSISRRQGIALGAAVGIAGSMGDAIESAVKRKAGRANSGAILPGYGGVLDRLDSLLGGLSCMCPLYRYMCGW